jgi:thiol-disulfide isomerase/thioredoxin
MELDKIFKTALTYSQYRELVNNLVSDGKTTGNSQNEKLVEFTKLNIQRMNRLDKTIILSEQVINTINANTKNFKWLLIGDAWCGDCAQIIPVINKIANAAKTHIEFRIISRDEYPVLIETYLTNGTKAIPKLLVIDGKTNEVICTWGPRPKPAQDIMLHWKANKDTITWENFEMDLHLWYARDKGINIINEFISLIENCVKKTI